MFALPRLVLWATLLLSGVALVVSDVLMEGPLVALDRWVHNLGWRYHAPGLDGTMNAVALLGQRMVIFLPALFVSFFLSRRESSFQPLLLMLTGTFLLNVTVGAVKLLTGRPVPRQGDMVLFLDGAMGFPSGHAANTVVTYGLLLYLLARAGAPHLRALFLAFCSIVLLVGVATVYLESHWVTDLIAGWLFGGLVLLAVLALDLLYPSLSSSLRERFNSPVPEASPNALTPLN